MEIHLQNAEFTCAEDIYACGLENVYLRLIASGMKPHFMAFIALSAGLEGRHWNDYSPEEKQTLRIVHDRLLKEKRSESELEAFLNKIGLNR